jgi:hypothetical protein
MVRSLGRHHQNGGHCCFPSQFPLHCSTTAHFVRIEILLTHVVAITSASLKLIHESNATHLSIVFNSEKVLNSNSRQSVTNFFIDAVIGSETDLWPEPRTRETASR